VSDSFITTAEMISTSPDGSIPSWPNKLKFTRRGKLVYVEISAVHDGNQVVSTVVVEAGVLRYHLNGSGLLHI